MWPNIFSRCCHDNCMAAAWALNSFYQVQIKKEKSRCTEKQAAQWSFRRNIYSVYSVWPMTEGRNMKVSEDSGQKLSIQEKDFIRLKMCISIINMKNTLQSDKPPPLANLNAFLGSSMLLPRGDCGYCFLWPPKQTCSKTQMIVSERVRNLCITEIMFCVIVIHFKLGIL